MLAPLPAPQQSTGVKKGLHSGYRQRRLEAATAWARAEDLPEAAAEALASAGFVWEETYGARVANEHWVHESIPGAHQLQQGAGRGHVCCGVCCDTCSHPTHGHCRWLFQKPTWDCRHEHAKTYNDTNGRAGDTALKTRNAHTDMNTDTPCPGTLLTCQHLRHAAAAAAGGVGQGRRHRGRTALVAAGERRSHGTTRCLRLRRARRLRLRQGLSGGARHSAGVAGLWAYV